MINYYELLNVSPIDEVYDINLAYKIKINKYNYNNLSNNDMHEIKLLKKARYVLTNPELKYKYDYLLYKSNHSQSGPISSGPISSGPISSGPISSGPISFGPPTNIPLPENDADNDNDLNSVFNVDNKWMQNNEFINNKQDNKLDNKLINGRIFDLSDIYNRQVNYEDIPQMQVTREHKN